MNCIKCVVDKALQYFLSLLMASMVIVITWQVLSRYALSDPSTWTEETARFLLIWIGMYGAAFAFSQKMHLGIDILVANLQGTAATTVNLITYIACGGFALAAMVIGGGNLVSLTWELNQTSPALGISIAFVYSAIPIAGMLICFYSVYFCCNPATPSTEDQQ